MVRWLKPESRDESQWVQELQLGIDVEVNARRIFDLYYPQLLGTLQRRCKSSADAEDLAQESFQRAFTRISQLADSRAFRSWLFAIALNSLRKRQRQSREPEGILISIEDSRDRGEGSELDPRSEEISPEEAAYARERSESLTRIRSRLPPQKQRIYHLRFEEELSVREIAEKMGLSEGTIKAHLSQIRRIFRDNIRGIGQ